MRYALVENGQVIEKNRELPRNWKNISNFYLMDVNEIKMYGWYPYTFVESTPFENSVIDGSYLVVEDDAVVEYQTRRQKTQDELDNEIKAAWDDIRTRRNMLLLDSDWTQLSDSPLLVELKEQWMIYRQELRDITNQSNPFDVVWPIEPPNAPRIVDEII
jgi:hypothetical protein